MSLNLNPQAAISGDTLTIIVQTMTKAIETTAGLSVKVDSIVNTQNGQSAKLDGLLVGLSELKTQTSNMQQAVENTRREIADHESRLRVLEPTYIKVEKLEAHINEQVGRFDTYKKEQDIHNDTQAAAIISLEKSLLKYSTIGICILAAAQLIFSVFIAPWLQGLIK